MDNKPPDSREKAALQHIERCGLVHTRDIAGLGIPTVVLTRLVRSGQLQRVGRGVYTLPNKSMSALRSFAEVSLRAPRGVICLLSALRIHEIGTQAPFEIWLALPPGVSMPRITSPGIRVVRMSGSALKQGIEKKEIDSVQVPVFNAAKTVADCFKFRNKIGLDVALEALQEAWRTKKATMNDLWLYAEANRVSKVMQPYMEALVG